MKNAFIFLSLLVFQSTTAEVPVATAVLDLNARAEALIKSGDYEGAIQSIQQLDGLSTWHSAFLLGTANLMRGSLEEAAAALDMALAMEGQVAEVWVQRAIVEQERDEPETALRLLKVALELDSGCVEALLNVGYAYETMGRIDDARVAYAEYLRISSGRLTSVDSRKNVVARLAGALD